MFSNLHRSGYNTSKGQKEFSPKIKITEKQLTIKYQLSRGRRNHDHSKRRKKLCLNLIQTTPVHLCYYPFLSLNLLNEPSVYFHSLNLCGSKIKLLARPIWNLRGKNSPKSLKNFITTKNSLRKPFIFQNPRLIPSTHETTQFRYSRQ